MVGWLPYFLVIWHGIPLPENFSVTPKGGQGPRLRNPGVEVFVELLKNKEYQILEHLGKLSYAAGLKWHHVEH